MMKFSWSKPEGVGAHTYAEQEAIYIRQHALEFLKRTGVRPTKLYLGADSRKYLAIYAQMTTLTQSIGKIERDEFDGMKIYVVDADDYVGVGV